MKVKELIEFLQKMNKEDYIFLNTESNGLCPPKEPSLSAVYNGAYAYGRIVVLEAEIE